MRLTFLSKGGPLTLCIGARYTAPDALSAAAVTRQADLREVTAGANGAYTLRLNDRVVELGQDELTSFRKVVDWLPGIRSAEAASQDLGMDEARLTRFPDALENAGLLYRVDQIPESVPGEEFHRRFAGSAAG